MKILFVFLSLLLSTVAVAQPNYLRGSKTIILGTSNGANNGELQILNSTRDTLGFLKNTGNGETSFFYLKKNDITDFKEGIDAGTTSQRPTIPTGRAILFFNTDSTAIERGFSGSWERLATGISGGTTIDMDSLATVIAGKENTITATTSADYYRGDKTFQPLNKAAVGLPNADNTTDANKPISIATQAALDLKAALSHTHTKSQITDFAHVHPISEITSLQAALDNKVSSSITIEINGVSYDLSANRSWTVSGGTTIDMDSLATVIAGKENTITATTSADYYRGDKTFQPLNKAAVGLPNADNTTDANKPISIATQAALDLKAALSHDHTKSQITDFAHVHPISEITSLQAALDDKVSVVSGKGLSTEDYTTAEKSKLAGITAGATVNQTDAYLLSRTNHTGTQGISTVENLQDSLNTRAYVYDFKKTFSLYEDFVLAPTTSSTSYKISVNGTGAGVSNTAPVSNRPGIISLNTGTSTTGRSAVHTDPSGFSFGGGPIELQSSGTIEFLNDGTQTFVYLTGFGDTWGGVNQTDGAYFVYDLQGTSTGSAASANFQTVTVNSGTTTFTTTSVAVATATYYNFKIEVNANATEVKFYINNTLVSTHTTNIPSTTARATGTITLLQKTAGATARYVFLDYMNFNQTFTTPR